MALTGNSVIESHLDERVPDTASEILVAELALNDIAAIQATRKGKAREDSPRSDADIAFDLQAASLRAFVGALHDHRFATSIDSAIESDTRQLRRFRLLERAELDDHSAAVALRDGEDLPPQTSSQRMMEQGVARRIRESRPAYHAHASDTPEASMAFINLGMENMHITTSATLETISHQPSSKDPDTSLKCVICGDAVVAARSFKAPCTHRYCRGCLVSLVETSLRDESLHPLRCCHEPLPLASGVFRFISTALRVQFLAKHHEYSVPTGSRVYCSNPRCSAFLGTAGDVQRDLACVECVTITCSQCKSKAHPGEDCSEHLSMRELQEMATANKWQTCPGCNAIVELSQGCYHITCRCSTQFCYLCSARWRTCDCRQWDEERLLNDADRRVRNEFGNWAAEMQPAVHAERIYQRMEALRENHNCRVHSWRYRHGCGQCEECGDFLSIFLMRCTDCQTLACRRCSVNRL